MERLLGLLTSLFPVVIRMSLSALLLTAAVLALRFMLRKAPKWTRVLLWALVALRLLCPILPESSLSLMPAEAVPVSAPAETISDAVDAAFPSLSLETGRAQEDLSVPSQAVPEAKTSAGLSASRWLPLVWILGVAGMLLYGTVSALRLRHLTAASVRLTDNVYMCDGIGSPFILGVFRPRIFVPSDLPDTQLAHVLAHERAHLIRRDHWWKPLGFLLLSIHWFNPAIWLAYVLLCRDIELACDERVYRNMGLSERADYSQTLLEQSLPRFRVAACPLAFGEVSVKERVKAALNYRRPAFWITAAAVLLCILAGILFLQNPTSFPLEFAKADVEHVTAWRTTLGPEGIIEGAGTSEADKTVFPLAVSVLTDRSEEIYGRLASLRKFRRSDLPENEPLYALTVSAGDKGELEIRGFAEDGSVTEIRYLGQMWRVTDRTFGQYVLDLCSHGQLMEADSLKEALEKLEEDKAKADTAVPDATDAPEDTALQTEPAEGDVGPTDRELADYGIVYDAASLEKLDYSMSPEKLLMYRLGAEGEYAEAADEAIYRAMNDGRRDEMEGAIRSLSEARAKWIMERYAEVRRVHSTPCSGVLGCDGWYEDYEISPEYFGRTWYTLGPGNEEIRIAEGAGFDDQVFTKDLDGDGIDELILNETFNADGVKRVVVFRRSGNTVLMGTLDVSRLDMPGWDDWGEGARTETYDEEEGFVIRYKISGKDELGTAGTEGTESFRWEEYAELP